MLTSVWIAVYCDVGLWIRQRELPPPTTEHGTGGSESSLSGPLAFFGWNADIHRDCWPTLGLQQGG